MAVAANEDTQTSNRHKNAIAHYRKWRKLSPKATRRERIEMFDFLVDHAQADPERNAA